MIKQATVEDISNLRVAKRHGLIVVTTHDYRRFLKRKLVDAYSNVHAARRCGDHDGAFEAIDDQAKFWLEESGWAKLSEYSLLAQTQDVYFVCHCRLGQRCHSELLLAAAARRFQSPVGRIYLPYPVFDRRLLELK